MESVEASDQLRSALEGASASASELERQVANAGEREQLLRSELEDAVGALERHEVTSKRNPCAFRSLAWHAVVISCDLV